MTRLINLKAITPPKYSMDPRSRCERICPALPSVKLDLTVLIKAKMNRINSNIVTGTQYAQGLKMVNLGMHPEKAGIGGSTITAHDVNTKDWRV